jgi:uncharacterized protein YoxC
MELQEQFTVLKEEVSGKVGEVANKFDAIRTDVDGMKSDLNTVSTNVDHAVSSMKDTADRLERRMQDAFAKLLDRISEGGSGSTFASASSVSDNKSGRSALFDFGGPLHSTSASSSTTRTKSSNDEPDEQ